MAPDMTTPHEAPAPTHLLEAVHVASGASDDWLAAALARRGVAVGRHEVGRIRRGERLASLGYYWQALHCLGPSEVAVALGVLARGFGMGVVGAGTVQAATSLVDLQGQLNRSIGRLLIAMSAVIGASRGRNAAADLKVLIEVLLELRHQVDQALYLALGGPPPVAPAPVALKCR